MCWNYSGGQDALVEKEIEFMFWPKAIKAISISRLKSTEYILHLVTATSLFNAEFIMVFFSKIISW